MTYGYIGNPPTQDKREGNKGVLSTQDIIDLKASDQLNGFGDDMLLLGKAEASSASTVEFKSDKLYQQRDWFFVWNNITFSTDGAYLTLNFSNDNGTTYSTSALYDSYMYYLNGTARGYRYAELTQTRGRIGAGTDNTAGSSLNGFVNFDGTWEEEVRPNPYASASYMKGKGCDIEYNSNTIQHFKCQLRYTDRDFEPNAIKVGCNTGTFSGTLAVYQRINPAKIPSERQGNWI